MSGELVLLRHGQSTANAAGRFTGLCDVPLSPRGEREAEGAARLMVRAGLHPNVIVTSVLQRAVRTAEIVQTLLQSDAPVERVWQLNERSYGALTGMGKAEARKRYGAAEFQRMRRSVDGLPPSMSERTWVSLRQSAPLAGLPDEAVQRSESLRDVIARVRCVRDRVVEEADAGGTVLVVAHGNSLRALSALIDSLTDAQVERLNLPTGQPLCYRRVHRRWVPRGGVYLDPDAVRAVAAVAAEGGT